MPVVHLIVGDYDNEGHEKTETRTFEVNCSAKQLNNAYKKGAKRINYDFELKVANEVGKEKLPKKVLAVLVEHGWSPRTVLAHNRELYVDDYVDIWLFIAKLGNPKLEAKPVTSVRDEIPIGGYGLWRFTA